MCVQVYSAPFSEEIQKFTKPFVSSAARSTMLDAGPTRRANWRIVDLEQYECDTRRQAAKREEECGARSTKSRFEHVQYYHKDHPSSQKALPLVSWPLHEASSE